MRAWLTIAGELLVSVLGLPTDTKVINCFWNAENSWYPNINLLIEHPNINTDYVNPKFSIEYDDNGNMKAVTFQGWYQETTEGKAP